MYIRKYEDDAAQLAADYRNTNPVEVLKTVLTDSNSSADAKLAPWMQKKLVLYRAGKEHLQPHTSDEYDDIAKGVSRVFDLATMGKRKSGRARTCSIGAAIGASKSLKGESTRYSLGPVALGASAEETNSPRSPPLSSEGDSWMARVRRSLGVT